MKHRVTVDHPTQNPTTTLGLVLVLGWKGGFQALCSAATRPPMRPRAGHPFQEVFLVRDIRTLSVRTRGRRQALARS